MVSAESATPSPLDTLMGASFWHRNRSRFIAMLAFAAVVLGISLFFRDSAQSARMAGWEELEDLAQPGQIRTHVDLSGPVRGTPAEPYALYSNAYSAYLDHNLDEAASLLARLETEFGDHILNQGPEVRGLKQDIEAERAWTATHSLPDKNPQVSDTNAVTIDTALGKIVLGLYPEHSPAAVRSFLDLVRSGGLQKGSFNEASPANVILSLPEPEPAEPETAEGEDKEAPAEKTGESEATGESVAENDAEKEDGAKETGPSPLALGNVPDRNRLSHYTGAVSFRRRYPGAIQADAQPQIMICLVDTPAMDNQQMVFGTVLQGLELLEQIATRDREEGGVQLKEPLSIQKIAEAPGLSDLK